MIVGGETGLGDAVDDVLAGSVGDDSGGGTSFSWNDALNSTGLSTIASGLFGIFGVKTNTGTHATTSGLPGASSSSTSPLVWLAGGAAAIGILALVLRKH